MYKCTHAHYNIFNKKRGANMSIYTFSVKSKKPEDDEVVLQVKEYCATKNINFSAIVVQQLKKFAEEHINGNS